MGIHNREYMRDDHPVGLGGMRGRDVVKTLIIVNVIVFVAQLLVTRNMTFAEFVDRHGFYQSFDLGEDVISTEELQREYELLRTRGRLEKISIVEDWGVLDPNRVFRGQIWRLTTYDFLHSTESIWHLLFNMWILFMAGRRVEAKYGGGEFLAFYLTAGVLSGVTFLLWGLLMGRMNPAIGASGAVVAVMIAYAVNWPQERWYILGIIPMPVALIAIFMAAWDIYPMLDELWGRMRDSHVAHAAHVGGMVFGFFYVRQRWRLLDWVPEKSSRWMGNPFRRRPKLRVHRPLDDEPDRTAPIPAHVEARVDQLLAKISEHGEASLTAEERAFLAESSRQYRNRRQV